MITVKDWNRALLEVTSLARFAQKSGGKLGKIRSGGKRALALKTGKRNIPK